MKVKIYKSQKLACQAGAANKNHWVMEFERSNSFFKDQIMGWNGSTDMFKTEGKLKFTSLESAVEYSKKNKFAYQVIDNRPTKKTIKSYLSNY